MGDMGWDILFSTWDRVPMKTVIFPLDCYYLYLFLLPFSLNSFSLSKYTIIL